MYATYQEKEIGYELQVQSYFYRLLYLMVTKYRKMNVSGEIVREHRNRNRLSSITGYIKENFKIFHLKEWRRVSVIHPRICLGCFGNMRRSIIKNMYRAFVWNMHTGSLPEVMHW